MGAEYVTWFSSLSLFVWIATCSPGQSGLKDYCQFEVFNATCGPGEVILMIQAHYGRMRLGRCLTTDVYIGCTADILPQLDARCSGRTHCEVHFPDSSLHEQVPCAEDLAFFMEAEYTCLQVAVASPEEEVEACGRSSNSLPSPIQVDPSGTSLASSLLVPGGLASPSCPWTLQVLTGQTIEVSILYFSHDVGYNPENEDPWGGYTGESAALYCPVTVNFEEPEQQTAKQVCVGQQKKRQEVVFNSRGNTVQITLSQQQVPETVIFILKAEGRGCPDPVLPSGGWLKRSIESATVGCNNTKQRWHLVCRDTHWVGAVENCTTDDNKEKTAAKQHITAPYGLLIAVLIGVIIGVVCGFTMLACVLWCKKRGTRRQRHPYVTAEAAQYGEVLVPDQDCKVHHLGEYGYTHVWEVQKQQRQPSLAGSLSRGRDAMEMCQTCTIRHSSGATPTVIFHKKEHIYESPQFAESVADSGITSEGSSVPFYHEFDLTNQPGGPMVPGDVKGDVTEGTSDDTDEDLEDKIAILIKPPGYNLVPKSPEGVRHENQYS